MIISYNDTKLINQFSLINYMSLHYRPRVALGLINQFPFINYLSLHYRPRVALSLINQFLFINYMSLHYRPRVTLLCTVGQAMSIDIIITSKSILHELFIIPTGSKVRFTPVITSFTLSTTDSLMNNLFMAQS